MIPTRLTFLFLALTTFALCSCKTVSKDEQIRRAEQRQTDYTAEINRRRQEAETNERFKDKSWWDILWGDVPPAEKTPPRELTEAELNPRR